MKWIYLCLLVLVSACANRTNFQTGRVENADYYHSTVILGYGAGLPYLEYDFRYGIGYHLEVGGKYTFPGPLSFSGKWQFVDTDRYAVAATAGVGGGYYFGGIEGLELAWKSRTGVGFVEVPFGVIGSVELMKKWSAYCSLRLTPTMLMGRNYRELTQNISFGPGMKIGEKTGVFFEVNVFKSLTYSDSGVIYSFAYYY